MNESELYGNVLVKFETNGEIQVQSESFGEIIEMIHKLHINFFERIQKGLLEWSKLSQFLGLIAIYFGICELLKRKFKRSSIHNSNFRFF